MANLPALNHSLRVGVPSEPTNPFKAGELVLYTPSSHGRGLLVMTDLSALVPGQIYRVASVQECASVAAGRLTWLRRRYPTRNDGSNCPVGPDLRETNWRTDHRDPAHWRSISRGRCGLSRAGSLWVKFSHWRKVCASGSCGGTLPASRCDIRATSHASCAR